MGPIGLSCAWVGSSWFWVQFGWVQNLTQTQPSSTAGTIILPHFSINLQYPYLKIASGSDYTNWTQIVDLMMKINLKIAKILLFESQEKKEKNRYKGYAEGLLKSIQPPITDAPLITSSPMSDLS